MGISLFSYVLGIAMIILGITEGKEEGFIFGLISIFCATVWAYKAIMSKRTK